MPPKPKAATWVDRILKPLKAFKPVTKKGSPRLPEASIPKDQAVLGIYTNDREFVQATIVTSTSLWVCNAGAVEEIRYEAISSATWSPEEERLANNVVVHLHDGSSQVIPVRSSQAGKADVFEFARFVSSVIGKTRQSDG
jgi:hypothetical protein